MANRFIKIREGNISDLIDIYESSLGNIYATINDATTAGKIVKFRVMNRINSELESLGVDVNQWVKDNIPQYYQDGRNIAIQDLEKMGVDTSVTAANAATVNREAIKALTDEVSLAFGDTFTSVSRAAGRLLNDTLKKQLNFIMADGKLQGADRKMIAADVKSQLADNGLSVLVDKSGRKWSLDTYSDMLVRTKAVEARNYGLSNQMLSMGYDLVQVSNSGSSHPACAEWEGQILSLTGQTDGYPTVDEATDSGLFHPNCEHAINVITPELADKTDAYNPDDESD